MRLFGAGFPLTRADREPRHSRALRYAEIEHDPTIGALIREAERQSQRVAARVRVAIIMALGALAVIVAPYPVEETPIAYIAFVIYLAIAALSWVLAIPRFFRPIWSPLFVVLDVLWFYLLLTAGVLLLDVPFVEVAALPTFLFIFVLIALAGMRYTPWTLLAGLATFAMVDLAILLTWGLGWWQAESANNNLLFDWGTNLLRIAIILAVGMITALTSLRARHTLVHALYAGRELDVARRTFGKFVPEAVADRILADHGTLAPVEREATVLFTDIRGFTTICERRSPEDVVAMVGAYFTAIEAAISAHGGVVAQFQGDAVMAVFNIPVELPGHADCALAAAQEIRRLTAEQRFAGEILATRIGVESGPVVAGGVGGADRISYTAYGDTVNVAARLEAYNKELGTDLLIGGHAAGLLSDHTTLRKVGSLPVRGRVEPVEVFTADGLGFSAYAHSVDASYTY